MGPRRLGRIKRFGRFLAGTKCLGKDSSIPQDPPRQTTHVAMGFFFLFTRLRSAGLLLRVLLLHLLSGFCCFRTPVWFRRRINWAARYTKHIFLSPCNGPRFRCRAQRQGTPRCERPHFGGGMWRNGWKRKRFIWREALNILRIFVYGKRFGWTHGTQGGAGQGDLHCRQTTPFCHLSLRRDV